MPAVAAQPATVAAECTAATAGAESADLKLVSLLPVATASVERAFFSFEFCEEQTKK